MSDESRMYTVRWGAERISIGPRREFIGQIKTHIGAGQRKDDRAARPSDQMKLSSRVKQSRSDAE